MAIVDGKVLTPDAAIAKGLCPETGIPLAGVNIEDHIARTWVAPIAKDPSGDEPRRRIQMLRDWAKANVHLHPKYDDNKNLIVEGA